MTSWIVGHTKRFKAALSERAVNNLVSAVRLRATSFWIFERQFGGPMRRTSTSALADVAGDLRAATSRRRCSSLHSENDLRCNIEQGEHLFTLLRLLGKEVEMLALPGRGPRARALGVTRAPRQRFEAILDWFGRYLASATSRSARPHGRGGAPPRPRDPSASRS